MHTDFRRIVGTTVAIAVSACLAAHMPVDESGHAAQLGKRAGAVLGTALASGHVVMAKKDWRADYLGPVDHVIGAWSLGRSGLTAAGLQTAVVARRAQFTRTPLGSRPPPAAISR